jgi:hypothetical protein
MRSYTNKKGEIVEVSKEHLDTAVELKILLQKDNPSHRCSWVQHKKLMINEGYDDSENSENYRNMIKVYQKSLGRLPSADTYADKVVTSKLNSYKGLVGEVAYHKREAQNYLREIRKGKRDITDGVLFIEEVAMEVRNVLSQVEWEDIMNTTFSPVEDKDGTRMILCLTDWHIGAVVDVEGNKYNFEVAQRRIHDAVDQAMALAIVNKVYRIDVVYQGDILEHSYMRNSQAYHAEFPVSRQMALGGRLMIEVLSKLSDKFFTTYRGFAGNHDRMNGNKNDNIDGDTGMVVVNEIVEQFITASKKDNLMYVDTHHFHARLMDVNGRNFKFVHGDLEKKADTKKIADHGSRDKVHYDAIVYGHFHHYLVLEVGVDRFEIRVGSTKGSDDFSEKLGLGSAPSQTAILVRPNGEIKVERLRLY